MLECFSRMIASAIPGALYFDSISGRAYRSNWFIEGWIDRLCGPGHCFNCHQWENRVRLMHSL